MLLKHPVDDGDGLLELRVLPVEHGEESESGHLNVDGVRDGRPWVALLEVLQMHLPPFLTVLDLCNGIQQPESLVDSKVKKN